MSKLIERSALVLGMIVLLGLLAMLLLRQPFNPMQPLLGVSFAGHTTSADGQIFAMFALSNRVSIDVVYILPQPVVMTNGNWSQLSSAGRSHWLKPGEEDIVSVLKPTDAEAWKLPVFHAPAPSKPAVLALRACRAVRFVPATVAERIEMNASLRMRIADSDVQTD
jgi:hypothetical protein